MLVTGADGFVGRHLVRIFSRRATRCGGCRPGGAAGRLVARRAGRRRCDVLPLELTDGALGRDGARVAAARRSCTWPRWRRCARRGGSRRGVGRQCGRARPGWRPRRRASRGGTADPRAAGGLDRRGVRRRPGARRGRETDRARCRCRPTRRARSAPRWRPSRPGAAPASGCWSRGRSRTPGPGQTPRLRACRPCVARLRGARRPGAAQVPTGNLDAGARSARRARRGRRRTALLLARGDAGRGVQRRARRGRRAGGGVPAARRR